jgi:hypothetical protein
VPIDDAVELKFNGGTIRQTAGSPLRPGDAIMAEPTPARRSTRSENVERGLQPNATTPKASPVSARDFPLRCQTAIAQAADHRSRSCRSRDDPQAAVQRFSVTSRKREPVHVDLTTAFVFCVQPSNGMH